MNKFYFLILLLSQFFIFNSSIENAVAFEPFDWDSNYFYSLGYSSELDYFILRGPMLEHRRIDFNISYNGGDTIRAFYHFTDKLYLIDDFYDMDIENVFTKADVKLKSRRKAYSTKYNKYHTFYGDYSDDNYLTYGYLAFYIPYYDPYYAVKLKTKFSLTTGQTLLIVGIVAGVLIFFALLSMGIAKLMGKSALDGLVCCLLVFTICCACKR